MLEEPLVYWTFALIPEIQHLSPSERSVILRKSVRRGTLIFLWVQAIIVGYVVAAAIVMLSFVLITGDVPNSHWMTAGIGVAALVCVPLWFQMQIRRIRAQLRESVLRDSKSERLPVCLGCGYDSRGTLLSRCPECGASLKNLGHSR